MEQFKVLWKPNIVWDERALDLWLTYPEAFIPGQRMGYQLTGAADRAVVIAAFLTAQAAPR